MEYKLTLSSAEDKALHFLAVDGQEWIENMVRERCRIAIEEIVSIEVQRLLAEGKPITGTKEDIVLAADIETAAEREERSLRELQELQEKQG